MTRFTIAHAKRKRKQPERQFKGALVDRLRIALPEGSIVTTIPGGAGGPTFEPGYLAGFPDVLALVPQQRPFLIECKHGKNTVSDAQADVHAKLIWVGVNVTTAWDFESVEKWLRSHGVRLRARVAA